MLNSKLVFSTQVYNCIKSLSRWNQIINQQSRLITTKQPTSSTAAVPKPIDIEDTVELPKRKRWQSATIKQTPLKEAVDPIHTCETWEEHKETIRWSMISQPSDVDDA